MEARTDTSDGSYIHLVGPATIHATTDGKILLYLLDKNRTPINDPIQLGSQISFVNMHMVTEFSPQMMAKHNTTITQSDFPFVELAMISDPTDTRLSKFTKCMTSTDPPGCDNTVIG
ncbi:hypothetical protein [Spirosoma sp.]|uniref:hypothetical protein n=1 Tax=Spirosoma sp. TaxID=1899569 RepID=UPI002632E737|nr:hypothetical protein [Spirosoma sp.]MCX6218926.1 hypothetical protein [Spirosoma sp.]